MNAITKLASAAMLVALSLTLAPSAAEPPKPRELPATSSPAVDRAAHAFLACDLQKSRIVKVDARGEVVWSHTVGGVHDVWALPDGKVLFARPSEIVEIDAEKKVLWKWRPPEKYSLHTCQALANGNVVSALSGADTRIVEVNRKGEIVVDIRTVTHSKKTRLCRKTPDNTYLVAAWGNNEVWEYGADGRLVRTIPAPRGVYLAVRLPNGDTLFSGGEVTRVDREGKIIWQVTRKDLPNTPLRFVAGFQLLRNGNIVLCNYGFEKHAQLIELNPAKEVVWQVDDPERFGTPVHVQVLDEAETGSPAR